MIPETMNIHRPGIVVTKVSLIVSGLLLSTVFQTREPLVKNPPELVQWIS